MLATIKTLYYFSWQPVLPPASCDSREQDWGLAATPKWKGNWPCTQLPESPNKWYLLRGLYEIRKARLLSAHIITFINCTNQQCFQHKDSLGVASRGEGQKKEIPTQQGCHRQCSMQSTSLGMHSHLWLGSTWGNMTPVRLAWPGCKRGKGKSKLSNDRAEVRPHAKMWLSEPFHTQLLCPHV